MRAPGVPSIAQILAATDFSPASTHALCSAADLSARLSARLSVVHVVPSLRFPYPVAPSSAAIEAAQAQLAEEVARLGAGVLGILREGSPAEEIVAAAR